jgi:glucose-1-phosphate cytidylyltransferase
MAGSSFKKDIFNHIKEGEELIEGPFQRPMNEKELITYKFNGLWVAMDTFKDKQLLDDIYSRGNAPWEIWKYNK